MFFNDAFKADYYRMTGQQLKPNISFLLNFALRHNIRYMYWFRCYSATKRLFYRYQLYRFSRKYGLEFSTSAIIGPGLYLGHPYNITVGEGTVIGKNVNIHKGATLGVENRGKRIGAPEIGNSVFVGINATILGKVRIGDDVLIAPGAFVNFDVPSHSVVVGNPGKIYHRDNATEDYVRNHLELLMS